MLKARVVDWCYAGELSEPAEYATIATTAERFAVAVAVDLAHIAKGRADG